jgi:hypothetical protein
MAVIESPITFWDDVGVRWTVVARRVPRTGQPDDEVLIFTSESGERRSCDGCLPEGAAWENVQERAWRTLLRHSESVRDD